MATPAVSVTPSGGLQGLPKASNSQPSLQENADKSEDNVKQRFCLKWNNYQSNVTSTFKDLLAVEDFVDITLSAEGGALRAHKVVLSACSPYFRDILKGISAWQHPVIVLKDVPYEDLQGIVEFIYHGEVSVDKECLDSFLKTAQMLRVKGLTDESSSNSTSKSVIGNNQAPPALAANLGLAHANNPGRVHSRKSSKPKKSILAPPLIPFHHDMKLEEDEIDDVEEEEINDDEEMMGGMDEEEEDDEEEEEEMSPLHIPHPFLAGLSPASITNAALALAAKASNMPGVAVSSTPCSNELLDDEQRKQRQQLLMGAGAGGTAGSDLMDSTDLFASSFGYPPPPLKNMLNLNGSNMAANPNDHSIQSSQASSSSGGGGSLSQKKTCPYCYQQLSWHALSRHIRDMHKAKSNYVTCKFCNKMFRNKNSLGCHMWRFHKEAKDKDKDLPMDANPGQSKLIMEQDQNSAEAIVENP